MKKRWLTVVVAVVAWGTAGACQFDTDCQVGSKCLKQSGQLYGMCVGGMQPGNNFDQRPVRDPLDINHSAGNTCQFDPDCGPGSKCMKTSGQLYGTCMRGR
jgi:hypothetical protein